MIKALLAKTLPIKTTAIKTTGQSRMLSLLTIMFISLLTNACVNKSPNRELAKFDTRITESGLKHFQVTIKHNRKEQSPEDSLGKRSRRNKKDKRTLEQTRKHLIQLADVHILENHYCRNGYWLLDEQLYPPKQHIRGECNDAANKQDKQDYPDTIHHW
ncbi:MAG: hypothetical protein COA42_07565 [Alteromonadaceae bacterium]|nr:MAG: hypothetical protein COA42_07565 [Alteromonadaceae bacterium]